MSTSWISTLFGITLIVTSATSGHAPVVRHTRSIPDLKLDPMDSDKNVQSLEMQLETKNEEIKQNVLMVHELSANLSAALHQVEQLTESETLLQKKVANLSRLNAELGSQIAAQNLKIRVMSSLLNNSVEELEVFSDTELHLNNSLNDYYRNQDWAALRRRLETILDRHSEAYAQLQSVTYGHGYPLWKIGSYCMVPLAEVLMSGARGPHIAESDGDTMLHGAAESGCTRLIDMMLDRGADIDVRDNGGATPLVIASRYGNLAVVKSLHERGADVNSADDKGDTGLHLAAEGGHLNVVKYLVESGVDIEATDNEDRTPFRMAKARGREDVIAYLSGLPRQYH